ncbi:MAG: hypothetical protein J2P51_17660 [Hyphomicrobiaceae bacterium]|nr:hypothetical protein [Hyphomicrobiaceae bacterium]
MKRQQILEQLDRLSVRMAFLARRGWHLLVPLLVAGWSVLRPLLRTAIEVLVALIIVFEEWGWRPLADLVGRLARWRPWAMIEAAITRLPPYAAFIVFVLPTALLLPLKFLALFLIAQGQIFMATLLFIAAKLVATALIARLYLLTEPALMQIGWFAWAHDSFMPLKEALTARVRSSWVWREGRWLKQRAKRAIAAQAHRWQPTIEALKPTLAASLESVRAHARQFVALIKERWTTLRSF